MAVLSFVAARFLNATHALQHIGTLGYFSPCSANSPENIGAVPNKVVEGKGHGLSADSLSVRHHQCATQVLTCLLSERDKLAQAPRHIAPERLSIVRIQQSQRVVSLSITHILFPKVSRVTPVTVLHRCSIVIGKF